MFHHLRLSLIAWLIAGFVAVLSPSTAELAECQHVENGKICIAFEKQVQVSEGHVVASFRNHCSRTIHLRVSTDENSKLVFARPGKTTNLSCFAVTGCHRITGFSELKCGADNGSKSRSSSSGASNSSGSRSTSGPRTAANWWGEGTETNYNKSQGVRNWRSNQACIRSCFSKYAKGSDPYFACWDGCGKRYPYSFEISSGRVLPFVGCRGMRDCE